MTSGDSQPAEAVDEIRALRQQLDALQRRIADLEAERDEFAQQNAELFVLQQVFSTINSTLEIDDILSMVLRGIREALHFNRVILFDVEEMRISRRLETDSDGLVTPSPNPYEVQSGPVLDQMVVGTRDFFLGVAGQEESPVTDTRGTFCMLPLISRDTVRGILYVDDPPSPEISDAQVRMLLDFAAQAAIAIENARLYNETRRLLEETQRLALTDTLTGIANRRALNDLLEHELANAERYEQPLAFSILDLDDLKRINDSSGHAAGDWALKNFADVLRRTARRGDIVARYAGDEFVIVMTKTDRLQAKHAMERIFRTLRREGVRCSVGVAMYPFDGTEAQALFTAADEALYQAKMQGKNRFQFFDEIQPAGGELRVSSAGTR